MVELASENANLVSLPLNWLLKPLVSLWLNRLETAGQFAVELASEIAGQFALNWLLKLVSLRLNWLLKPGQFVLNWL